jgi:hypothetical protein
MSSPRTCATKIGNTVCGKMAVGYVLLEPPGGPRYEWPCCEEHAKQFEGQDGPPFIRYDE